MYIIVMNWLKENIAVTFAWMAFIFGWTLTIIGFFIPPTGEISSSVLWVLGQSLAFAGSVVGITYHFDNEILTLRNEIQKNQNIEK